MPAAADTEIVVSASTVAPPATEAVTVTVRFVAPSAMEV